MNLSQNYMGVSENNGTPKSSILIGFSIINHPFWDIPIFGNTHMYNPFGKKNPGRVCFGGVIYIAQATCGSAETWGKFGPGWIAVDWIVLKTRHFLEKAIGWPWVCAQHTWVASHKLGDEWMFFQHAISHSHQPANRQSLAARPLAKHLGFFVPESAEERTAKIKANQWNQIHTRPY